MGDEDDDDLYCTEFSYVVIRSLNFEVADFR